MSHIVPAAPSAPEFNPVPGEAARVADLPRGGGNEQGVHARSHYHRAGLVIRDRTALLQLERTPAAKCRSRRQACGSDGRETDQAGAQLTVLIQRFKGMERSGGNSSFVIEKQERSSVSYKSCTVSITRWSSKDVTGQAQAGNVVGVWWITVTAASVADTLRRTELVSGIAQ